MDRTIRKANRTPSETDPGEDQTDRLENQKAREFLQKDRMFNLPSLELERRVRGEILQARFSIQKTLEEEGMGRCFERKGLGENQAGLLQNHPSRFS
ncbi:MAG TPA: hypothetical protein VF765_34230, partial [Polyangiaceae bacterium]